MMSGTFFCMLGVARCHLNFQLDGSFLIFGHVAGPKGECLMVAQINKCTCVSKAMLRKITCLAN